jgi:hypothetical protein
MSHFVLLVARRGSGRELDSRQKEYSTAVVLSVRTDTVGRCRSFAKSGIFSVLGLGQRAPPCQILDLDA